MGTNICADFFFRIVKIWSILVGRAGRSKNGRFYLRINPEQKPQLAMAAKKKLQNVCTHITSKRIELEGPGWSGFVRF